MKTGLIIKRTKLRIQRKDRRRKGGKGGQRDIPVISKLYVNPSKQNRTNFTTKREVVRISKLK